MALEIKVGPPQLAIHHGHSVLLTDPDGGIPWPSDKGLYVDDTRLISNWSIYANGAPWELLSSGTPTHDLARIYLSNAEFLTESGQIAARTLALSISRRIEGGVHEDLDLVNHSGRMVRFNLEIAMRSDFADIFEVKSTRIVRRGRITTDWLAAAQRLETSYNNQDFHRCVAVSLVGATAVYANGRLSWEIELAPGAAWHVCLFYRVSGNAGLLPISLECSEESAPRTAPEAVVTWREQVMKLQSSNKDVENLYRQAIDDMAALRLPIAGTDHLQFVPAAGLPWFVALFGRDSLIVSLQNILVYPDFAYGVLDLLGRYQADAIDAHRDAEPGKIPHELRIGELAHFHLVPHTPYYGTADATPLYLIVLHATWRATGDNGLLDRHLATAEGCLRWIDQYGDRDGDLFQEYQTRSEVGYENQGWKDAGDALVYPDGSLVRGPKALCELQGYVYDAWCRMAEIYDVLERPDDAAALRAKAADLFARFNQAFWNEADGSYAFALDGEKNPVWSVASNQGHCLWSGIVPPERAARVVKRLMRPDMWSGWGIRTLSANHPSFNPHSYQNGSVWPHDNGLIALGFRRYGFAAEAAAIARDIIDAGGFFALSQLPELYAGLQRDGSNFPVQYPGANVPQAWAAGSVFSLVQALLGIQPDAPNNVLYVDPHLPAWLPDLRLSDLQMNGFRFDILFHDRTEFTVIEGDPRLVKRLAFDRNPGLCPGPAKGREAL
jgi:glycogen debranching enzyme